MFLLKIHCIKNLANLIRKFSVTDVGTQYEIRRVEFKLQPRHHTNAPWKRHESVSSAHPYG